MKRCPQCEFIYEDDQSLCDMDGILLVFDAQQLPKPHDEGKKKQHWRSRLVTALATFVLATVLYLVYYVSTHQQPVPPTYTPASSSAVQPQTNPLPVEKASNAAASTGSKESKENDSAKSVPEVKATGPIEKVTTSKEEKSKANAKPSPKVVKESSDKPKVKSQNQSRTQEGSKIGSLLKKTGRILKKPFKF